MAFILKVALEPLVATALRGLTRMPDAEASGGVIVTRPVKPAALVMSIVTGIWMPGEIVTIGSLKLSEKLAPLTTTTSTVVELVADPAVPVIVTV